MAKALPFGEIKLAFLQLLVASMGLFFGALAVLDIDARSKPFDDIPVFITKRQLPM